MNLPALSIPYLLAGSACVSLGLWKNREALFRSLGATALFIAAFNAYVEEYNNLRDLTFETTALLLLVGFMGAYTSLVLHLITPGRTGPRWAAFNSSFLPVVYALSIGFAFAFPGIQRNENPPLSVYLGIVLICSLHVPAFAYGRRLKANVDQISILAANRQGYVSHFREPLIALGLPFLANLAVEIFRADEWVLAGSNALITVVILALFAIVRT